MNDRELLRQTSELAASYLESLGERPVAQVVDREALRASLGAPLGEDGVVPQQIVAMLACEAEPGLVASAGPRYFGFVTGGALPAALAADWLVSAWDQNAGLAVMSPSAAVIEEVAAGWVVELLGLPAHASVGFVTGAQMANVTALAAARHEVLRRVGWDVEAEGLQGAPTIHVVAGGEAHVSISAALRLVGLGAARVIRAESDAQGRMRPDALAEVLRQCDGPTIVCAQAGNVNSGAFDPFDQIADLTQRHGAWLHVDGAFGLWAAASPALRHLALGVERADSWATDAHKWLNVNYDSGIAIVAHPAAHRAAMSFSAAYLIQGVDRDGIDWGPESSRRARGVPVYAALRQLGRQGVAEMVDRCCAHARRFAESLGSASGVQILNDVVLNQVMARFHPPHNGQSDADADAFTRGVITRVQRDGTCWLGGTTWHGQAAMRISISNWSTTESDVDRSVDAILRAAREEAETVGSANR